MKVIMYHEIADRPRACSVERFKAHVTMLVQTGTPITAHDLERFIYSRNELPADAFLLTFDHGTKDHITTVAPILEDSGIRGIFLPYMLSLEEQRMCAIDKQRAIEINNQSLLIDKICNELHIKYESKIDYLHQYPWYTEEDRFIRYVRDYLIGHYKFDLLVEDLFSTIYDEAVFVEEHYLSWSDIDQLSKHHDIGSHGYYHATEGFQVDDITRSASLLSRKIGTISSCYSYPNGKYDKDVINLLQGYGFKMAFTTDPRMLCEKPFEIGRIDQTNILKEEGR